MESDARTYAVLGLIAETGALGIHGYRLQSEFESRYGEVWSLNRGQLYRALDALARFNLIVGEDEPQEGRPARKVFRITERGRKRFDGWMQRAPRSSSAPLEDSIALRLLFWNEKRSATTLAMVAHEREVLQARLARLVRRQEQERATGRSGVVAALLLRQAELRGRSELLWLDAVEAELRACSMPTNGGVESNAAVVAGAPPIPMGNGPLEFPGWP